VEKENSHIGEFIERYRFYIGGGLLILILVGTGILLWKENYFKPKQEARILNQESRIKELTDEVSKIQETITKQTTNSNNQPSNTIAPAQDAGQVAGASASQPASQPASKSATAPKGKININSATLSQLDSLTGIGPVYAQRIIDYRNERGGFKSIDELKNVKGIGEKTFDKFKNEIAI
jgi:comEA protein